MHNKQDKKKVKSNNKNRQNRQTVNNRTAIILEKTETGFKLYPDEKATFKNRKEARKFLYNQINEDMVDKEYIIALLDKEITFEKTTIKVKERNA